MKIPTLEEVLDAFSMEPHHGKAELEQYIHQYPQYAIELVDLSRRLLRPVKLDLSPLSAEELKRVDAAWVAHAAMHPVVSSDPLATLDVAKSRELSKALDLPRQVIAAFRERRVKLSTIPRAFLTQLSEKLGTSIDGLVAALSQPMPEQARSYSSNEKPIAAAQISFEQLLIEANVPPDKRAAVLAEGD